MHTQETCIDCGKLSPPTNTDHTLTSSFGWRMSRRANDAGEMVSEWRCAACWAKFKVTKGARGAPGATMAPGAHPHPAPAPIPTPPAAPAAGAPIPPAAPSSASSAQTLPLPSRVKKDEPR